MRIRGKNNETTIEKGYIEVSNADLKVSYLEGICILIIFFISSTIALRVAEKGQVVDHAETWKSR